MFDRPRSGERAVLVHVQDAGAWLEDEICEFRELAVAAGAQCVAESQARLRRLDSRYLGVDRKAAGERYDYPPELTSWNHAFAPAINHSRMCSR